MASIPRRHLITAHGFPDGPFPPGYGPVSTPVAVDHLRLYALQPLRDGVPRTFILRAYDGVRLVGERRPHLAHENRLGLDAEDVARLEAATEDLLQGLGAATGVVVAPGR